MSNCKLISMILIAVCSIAALAQDEETASSSDSIFTLNTGEQVTGTLEKTEDSGVKVKSPSLGEVTIGFDKLESIDGKGCGDVQYCGLTLTPPPAYTYSGYLAVAGSFSSGNKEEENWDVDLNSRYRSTHWRHTVEGYYESESLNDTAPLEEHELSYALDYFFGKKFYWANRVSWGADENKSIVLRHTAGTGIGYAFWQNDKSEFDVEVGVTWVKEKYQNQGELDGDLDDTISETQETGNGRLAMDYRKKLFGSLNFFHKNEYLQNVNDSEDWEISTETGFTIPLVKKILADVKYEWDYDNRPAAAEEKRDTALKLGVRYSW